ncbi:MAG: primosomal protein N' [Chlamydiae bacterium]|nr:primosomal protein N' [Chlamydiota bacterium]MBI3265506.1 primosomal protein N' [Chlamydiota bacterium]
MNYARLFFEVPLKQGFDYLIPEHLRSQVVEGSRVLAPFGRARKWGYVKELLVKPDVSEVKEILEIAEGPPVFTPALFQLAQWMSDYYLSPLGMVLRTMLPGPFRKFRSATSRVKETLFEEENEMESPHLLNEEQKKAQGLIFKRLDEAIFSVVLIHGVTGSGKTELYLSSIEKVLAQGKDVIVLVPEISLTPQTVERVKNRFGKIVALMHSRMSEGERVKEWERIQRGEARIGVGPRSAVFAPFRNLGLIIVDEEHERTYKQEEMPRYQGRDVAIMRAKFERAVVLLGSATPALESYFNAEQGKYDLVTLLKRVMNRPMPEVRVVDMRKESEAYGRLISFSKTLSDEINERLKRREQVILFLNRRGYAPMVLCPKCGHVIICVECDQAMTYHRNREYMLCHLCESQIPIPQKCPKCEHPRLHRLGVGTQRIETHLEKILPHATLRRMDTDSTRTKDAHEKILQSFRSGEVQILVGTQMIAKGLDFPNVTLVGVMSADVAMSLPDFRMGEHTFQLLTQVAGRSGRGDKKGVVLIQTLTPFHPVIRAAMAQDYLQFYKSELVYRKQLVYPPFSRIVSMEFEGKPEPKVIQVAKEMSVLVKKHLPSSTRVFGPHQAPISKIKGKFRWQIILFYPRGQSIHEPLRRVLDDFNQDRLVKVMIDVDPVSLI